MSIPSQFLELWLFKRQFELPGDSTVSSLKALINQRSKWPLQHLVLLLGCRRLHEELPMSRVAAGGGGVAGAAAAAPGRAGRAELLEARGAGP